FLSSQNLISFSSLGQVLILPKSHLIFITRVCMNHLDHMANENREAYVPSPELISSPPRQLDSLKEPRAYQQHNTLKEQPPENL
ncbi:hypothetical protein Tco_0301406, partial [Tanacetum coccineum]